jgi:hypothetical protein
VNVIDKPITLKIRFVFRDFVPSDRATCTIAPRVNNFDAKLSFNNTELSLNFDFEI